MSIHLMQYWHIHTLHCRWTELKNMRRDEGQKRWEVKVKTAEPGDAVYGDGLRRLAVPGHSSLFFSFCLLTQWIKISQRVCGQSVLVSHFQFKVTILNGNYPPCACLLFQFLLWGRECFASSQLQRVRETETKWMNNNVLRATWVSLPNYRRHAVPYPEVYHLL